VGEAATVCDEFKTKPRSGFGLNELLGRHSSEENTGPAMRLLGRSQDSRGRHEELRAHPDNHGMEPTDPGELELRAHPWVARARRENVAEGINERSQPCQYSPETTPSAFDLPRPNA